MLVATEGKIIIMNANRTHTKMLISVVEYNFVFELHGFFLLCVCVIQVCLGRTRYEQEPVVELRKLAPEFNIFTEYNMVHSTHYS